MSDPVEPVAPAAPATTVTPPTPPAAPVADPPANPAPPADPQAAAEPPKPKTPPWFQTRIDALTREKHEAKRETETLREQLRIAQGGQQPPANSNPAPAQPDIDRMVSERAAQMAQQQRFNDACNATFDAGMKEYGAEFHAVVRNFDMLGGLGAHPALVEATTFLPDGHRVLQHLGTNLDEAARIMSLSPVQMAVEITKISNKVKAKPISNAPAPITPITGGNSGDGVPEPNDKGEFKSQADFRAWREKQRRRA